MGVHNPFPSSSFRLVIGVWLVDVGFGSESPPLPIRLLVLAEAATQGIASWPAEAGWEPYACCDWAKQLPLQRLAQYRWVCAAAVVTKVLTPS